MIKEDYGIKRKPITARNPQANAIIERVHQTVGNILRTFRLQNIEVDKDDPWTGILSATMFAMRATVHTTLQLTPMQAVFGRDAILNVQHDANWSLIKKRKQKRIDSDNKRENKNRREHTYKVGDMVRIKNSFSAKYAKIAYKGPYPVTAVNNNGTVRVQMGKVSDTFNFRNVAPYVART
jgi:transposase InsO family protein